MVPTPPSTPDTAWFQALTRFGRQIEEQVRFKATTGAHEASMGQFVGARGLMAAGLYSDAVEMLSDLVGDAPEMAPAWELLARAQISGGNPQGAVGALEEWSARGGATAPSGAEVRSLRDAVLREGTRGYWLWQNERLDARAAAGEPVSPLDLAAARAGTGDTDGAFQALEQAVAQHDRGLVLLQRDPVWDMLRSDPRFADIARKSRTMHVVAPSPRTTRPR